MNMTHGGMSKKNLKKKKKLNYVETVHFSFCMKTAIKLY